MQQGSYEFDPCSIDGSNKEEDGVTLDNWTPPKKEKLYRQPSKWRTEKNDAAYGYMEPGVDEIKKIRAYLRNRTKDIEIMKQFAINADTLFAIKTNRFDPVEGIIKNQTDVLYKKQEILDKRLETCQKQIKAITKTLSADKQFVQWIENLVEKKVGQAREGMPLVKL